MVGGHLDYVPLLFTQKKEKTGRKGSRKKAKGTHFCQSCQHLASYWQYKSAVALRLSYIQTCKYFTKSSTFHENFTFYLEGDISRKQKHSF
jgi:hypothetical protein